MGAGEGIELALDLARAGRSVRLLDPNPALLPAAYIGSRSKAVLRWAGQAGLSAETGLTLEEVGNGTITIRRGDGGAETVTCAALIVAPGRKAHDPLSPQLLGTGIEVHVVGDAREPRQRDHELHRRVNRYMRDARAKCVAEGATEMHYAIIANQLFCIISQRWFPVTLSGRWAEPGARQAYVDSLLQYFSRKAFL